MCLPRRASRSESTEGDLESATREPPAPVRADESVAVLADGDRVFQRCRAVGGIAVVAVECQVDDAGRRFLVDDFDPEVGADVPRGAQRVQLAGSERAAKLLLPAERNRPSLPDTVLREQLGDAVCLAEVD